MTKINKNELGLYYEDQALLLLRKHGFDLVKRNYKSHFGEIDLIVKNRQVYVFAEVRYRDNAKRGLAQETICISKQNRIIKTALIFMQKFELNQVACRFDVIAYNASEQAEWIQNAFQTESTN